MYINVRMVNKFSSSLIASQFGKKKKENRNTLQPHAKTLIPTIINPVSKSSIRDVLDLVSVQRHSSPTWNYSKPSRLNSSVLEAVPLEIWKSFGGTFRIQRPKVRTYLPDIPDSISDKIVYPAILSYSKST